MEKLLFLGTGAADWDILKRKGFFRRNSAALLNEELMIDCGEHIFDFAKEQGRKSIYDGVTDIIITHNHSDHFSRQSLFSLAENQKIRVGCCGAIAREIGENPNIEFVILKPFERCEIGRYKVIPLLANHSVLAREDLYAFHYIIETPGKKKIFYGLDGAWFLRPSWQEMKTHKFDVMVLECTVGDRDDWRMFEHNTIPMLKMMMKEIRAQGLLKEGGRYIASHFARTLHSSEEETKELLLKEGIIAAFDGFEVEF